MRHKQRSVLETADHDVRTAESGGAGASRGGRARGPRARGRQHGARGDGGLPFPGRRRHGSGNAGRGRLAPAAGPAGRRRPLEPGRAGRRERGAGLAHGGGVRARARRRARGGGRRGLRGRRHAHHSRRCRARAQPRGGSGLRPGPLAARRAADRDHRRPLHLHRLPARLAPRRRGGADRASRGPADPRARLGRHAHPDPGRRPADAVDGGGLAGHHVGAARRGPAPGALAALRGGRRPRARRRPHRGAGLHRDDARPAAHDLRRPHAVRPQRRKPRGTGLRRDPGPPVRRRRERVGHVHVRPGSPLRAHALRGRGRDLVRRGGVPRSRGAPRDDHRLVRHAAWPRCAG